MKTKWSIEKVIEEGLKHKTRTEFSKNNTYAYALAKKLKLLDNDILSEHWEGRKKWNFEKIKNEALKFYIKKDFQKNSPSAYLAAHRINIINDVCSHMSGRRKWTNSEIKDEASKYTSKVEFEKNNSSAYAQAKKKKILDDVCLHMQPGCLRYSDAQLKQEILKHNTKIDFFRSNSKAYYSAQSRGLLTDGITCKHMGDALTGFQNNIPAIVYYIRFDKKDEFPIYKIGITNFSTQQRLRYLRPKVGISTKIIKEFFFEKGSNARELEKNLHKEFSDYRYKGEPIMNNGNTELFIKDVLNFDSSRTVSPTW